MVGQIQKCKHKQAHTHTPDEAQQQWTELSAPWFHSVRKLVHGAPQQVTKVSEVCAITNAVCLLQLLQKQNTNIPTADHIGPLIQH